MCKEEQCGAGQWPVQGCCEHGNENWVLRTAVRR